MFICYYRVFPLSESEVEPAQVFISYQWDIQDEVRALRNKLETAGFTCWMDIGQMGGGDQLYGKIDTAIRGCKVSSLTELHLMVTQCTLNGHPMIT